MLPATNNNAFITAAYTVAWIAVIGYWVFVHRAVRVSRARYEQAVAAAGRARGNEQ
jgi:hypothetical protein